MTDIIEQCRALPAGDRKNLINLSAEKAKLKGLVIECGVYKGFSITNIARACREQRVHGFDSFEGLREPWVLNDDMQYERGHFAIDNLPNVPVNVHLHKGWLPASLQSFLDDRPNETIRLLHIDTDTYETCRDILSTVNPHIAPGTVLVFDEICNWHQGGVYQNWRDGEYRALMEWQATYNRDVSPIARERNYAAAFIVNK